MQQNREMHYSVHAIIEILLILSSTAPREL